MDAKKFMEIMISVLEMQIGFVQRNERYDDSEYLQGQETGLQIAIEKLEAAAFLTEKGES